MEKNKKTRERKKLKENIKIKNKQETSKIVNTLIDKFNFKISMIIDTFEQTFLGIIWNYIETKKEKKCPEKGCSGILIKTGKYTKCNICNTII